MVLAAVKNYGGALEYASEELQQDEELQKMAEENLVDKIILMRKLEDINEDAHQYAMETWLEADSLEEENLLDEAEEKREEASEEQAVYFKEMFESKLTGEEKQAVWHYVKTDKEYFADQFYQWYRTLDAQT